jgi:hypothetical protein
MNTTCTKVLAFTMTGLVFPIRELSDPQPYLPISDTSPQLPWDQPHTPDGENFPVEGTVMNDLVASGARSNVSAQMMSVSSGDWILPSSGPQLPRDLSIATRLRQAGINVVVQPSGPTKT